VFHPGEPLKGIDRTDAQRLRLGPLMIGGRSIVPERTISYDTLILATGQSGQRHLAPPGCPAVLPYGRQSIPGAGSSAARGAWPDSHGAYRRSRAMDRMHDHALEKASIIRVLHDEPGFSEIFISHLLARNYPS